MQLKFWLALCFVLMLGTGLALAQDATPEAGAGDMPMLENQLVGGLVAPRGIAYDADGNLYVAEAGSGGATTLMETEEMTATAGMTSSVSMIAPDGTRTVVVPLPSVSTGFESLGAYRVLPTEDSLWVVISDVFGTQPFSDAIVELDMETHRIVRFIDLYAFEAENNPDEADPAEIPDAINSNPADIALADDGTLYIADAGANALLRWTEADGLSVVRAWTTNPVPTSVEIAADGSLYVGFLGQGIAPGAAHIEHLSADGSEVIERFDGFTALTDILLDEQGNLYAVEMAQFGEQGPDPMSGRVSMVTADGMTPVAEGLPFAFALAQAPDGQMAVSYGALAQGPDMLGGVVLIDAGM